MATEENPLYFGLDYYASVEAKKNLLSMEMFLLNTAKIIRDYYQLRADESKTKLKFQTAIKKLNTTLKKTDSFIHFSKIHKTPIKKEMKHKKNIPMINKNDNTDLELELRKIQEKLKSISR